MVIVLVWVLIIAVLFPIYIQALDALWALKKLKTVINTIYS